MPGIPSVRSGTSEPPTQALFPLSAAAIPSGFPLPNKLLNFDFCFAILYDTKAAIVAPLPGIIPTSVPTAVPNTIKGAIPFGIFSLFMLDKSMSSFAILFSLVRANICAIENIPMRAGIKDTPSYNST